MLVPNVDDNLVRVVITYAKQYACKENIVSKPSESPIYKYWTYPLVKIYILSKGYISSIKKIWLCLLWEPKMCRLAWQLLGMLDNVLGMLCNVLGMLATSSASSACFLQGPKSPTSKKNPSTCCLISCEAKGIVYHQGKACRGRCQACLGVAKQAYTS